MPITSITGFAIVTATGFSVLAVAMAVLFVIEMGRKQKEIAKNNYHKQAKKTNNKRK